MLPLIKAFILRLINRKTYTHASLKTYLDKQEGSNRIIKKYNEAHRYEYSGPESLEGQQQHFLPSQVQVGTFERYLAVLHNASLHTQEGYVQLSDNYFIVETTWSKAEIDPYRNKLFKLAVEYKKGNWFSSLLYWNSGYYHWVCDVLPRFYQVLTDLPADVQIIIPANATPWQVRSLELIGIARNRMVEFPLNKIWKLEHLYFAPPTAMSGDHMHEAVEWTCKTILNKLNVSDVDTGNKRIYISRGKAARRRIVNEDRLIEYLRKYDFQIINNESLNFDQQVILFHNASHIIAPHGAGLSNMLFSKAGSSVLEIFEKSTLRRCYWTLANAKNINYTCYIGNTVDINVPGEADIEIDMDFFETHFEAWLNKTMH